MVPFSLGDPATRHGTDIPDYLRDAGVPKPDNAATAARHEDAPAPKEGISLDGARRFWQGAEESGLPHWGDIP